MDPTTLVTFLFNAPVEIRTVELLGSWDNFTRPYQMHQDRRRGKGLWSGCFKFTDIVFDGDTTYWTKPRSGGLKQGGVYWYYYRLDYAVEAYNDLQEWTASCPLMPGQVVNVIEVPYEVVEPPSRCRSAGYWELEGTLSSWPGPMHHRQTLEPSDKFAALEPPPGVGRCNSDVALNGRLEGKMLSPQASFVSPSETPGGDDVQSQTLRSTSTNAHSSVVNLPAATSHRKLLSEDFSQWFLPHVPKPSHQDPSMDLEDAQVAHHDAQIAHSDVDAGDDVSEFGPQSVRDVQMYGSRPTTSHSGEQWRPRMYSLQGSSLDLHSYAVEDASGEPTKALEPSSLSPNCAAADQESNPLTDQGASSDQAVWSPTFSVATLSSNGGGLNTPFRLSEGSFRGGHNGYSTDQQALNDITERLRSLDPISSQPSPPKQHIAGARPPIYTGYTLPQPEIGSQHSLGKLSSRDTALAHNLPLPTILLETQEGGSLVDDIFSELGYLGGSIS